MDLGNIPYSTRDLQLPGAFNINNDTDTARKEWELGAQNMWALLGRHLELKASKPRNISNLFLIIIIIKYMIIPYLFGYILKILHA